MRIKDRHPPPSAPGQISTKIPPSSPSQRTGSMCKVPSTSVTDSGTCYQTFTFLIICSQDPGGAIWSFRPGSGCSQTATVAPSNQWRILPCPTSSVDGGNSLLQLGFIKGTSYTRFTDKRYCLFGTSRVQISARRIHILTATFSGIPQPLSPTARQCIPVNCTDTLPFEPRTAPFNK